MKLKIDLPIVSRITDEFEGYLIVNSLGIAFFAPKIAKTPYQVIFESGELARRATESTYQKELIARACILKNLDRPTEILDATAGFGRDAFILATQGANVQLLERNPIVAALLKDGLSRLSEPHLHARLTLIQKNAVDFFHECFEKNDRPDVVYLDPMFQVERNAKVKKDLQLLQMILQNETQDQENLLPLALEFARSRVVVKRAIFAEPLNKINPSYTLKGKHSRFDVYII